MSQIKGPAIFLAQFLGDEAPFNTLENITAWAKSLGFLGVQIPSWDPRAIDLDKAAESKDYCDDLKGRCNGLAITEIASHLQGQLVAVHPAYDTSFDAFAPPEVRGNPPARTEWAIGQMKKVIKAFHVKDAEFRPSARSGVYGGYQDWKDRPGRFRSAGDGQVDFKQVFTKLTEIGFSSWAVLEWECCVKDGAQGAKEGAELIRSMLIDTPKRAFDDFAGGDADMETNRRILGIEGR